MNVYIVWLEFNNLPLYLNTLVIILSEWFYEDRSDVTRQNKTLSLLVSLPNVIVTSHQAFLTHEALANIATTTLKNLDDYFAGAPLENEICYRCLGTGGAAKSNCPRRANGRCH